MGVPNSPAAKKKKKKTIGKYQNAGKKAKAAISYQTCRLASDFVGAMVKRKTTTAKKQG